jgi:hypothetical protein
LNQVEPGISAQSAVPQLLRQKPIHFDRPHLPRAFEQPTGQKPKPRTDLDNAIIRLGIE